MSWSIAEPEALVFLSRKSVRVSIDGVPNGLCGRSRAPSRPHAPHVAAGVARNCSELRLLDGPNARAMYDDIAT